MSIRRLLRIAGAVALLAASAAVWTACHYSRRARIKEHLEHPDLAPQLAQALGPPEVQLEDHTCGLHSLALVYRAHGLDPERERLRERLGVDVPAIEQDASTSGTLHPDLLRVLRQDHFEAQCLDLEGRGASLALERAVSARCAALVLVALPHSGGLHWVAAGRSDEPGRLRIFDSLVREPYDVALGEYLEQRALSVVTIAPDPSVEFTAAQSSHAEGLAEMGRVALRIAARAKK